MELNKAGRHWCLRQHGRGVATYLNMSPRPLRTPFLALFLSLSLSLSFSLSGFFFSFPPVLSRSFCLSSLERWPFTPGPAMRSPLVDNDSRPDLELPSVSSSTRTKQKNERTEDGFKKGPIYLRRPAKTKNDHTFITVKCHFMYKATLTEVQKVK